MTHHHGTMVILPGAVSYRTRITENSEVTFVLSNSRVKGDSERQGMSALKRSYILPGMVCRLWTMAILALMDMTFLMSPLQVHT